MDIHEYSWISIDVHAYTFICMDARRYPRISTDIHDELVNRLLIIQMVGSLQRWIFPIFNGIGQTYSEKDYNRIRGGSRGADAAPPQPPPPRDKERVC